MGRFRSSKSQSSFVLKQKLAIGTPRHGKKGFDAQIHSLGTARTYQESLACVAKYISENRLDPTGNGLSGLTKKVATDYLKCRSTVVSQKQLDKDRQSIEILLGEKITVIKSDFEQVLHSRAYTQPQIELVAKSQSPIHRLATLVAADGGLRAHELNTITPIQVRNPVSQRQWSNDLFSGRGDVRLYTVVGKGGLKRKIAIRTELAERLEECRFPEPMTVVDREIFYKKFYDIGGGHQWSDSFTKASLRVLGWTSGGHGLRHSYAQARMQSLQLGGSSYYDALGIVSQEMGHFRAEITEVYLR